MDFTGPMETTKAGHRIFVVLLEHLTGCQTARAGPTETSPVEIDFLRRMINEISGFQRDIVTDNGPTFTASALVQFLNMAGSKWSPVVEKASHGNGHTERVVGT